MVKRNHLCVRATFMTFAAVFLCTPAFAGFEFIAPEPEIKKPVILDADPITPAPMQTKPVAPEKVQPPVIKDADPIKPQKLFTPGDILGDLPTEAENRISPRPVETPKIKTEAAKTPQQTPQSIGQIEVMTDTKAPQEPVKPTAPQPALKINPYPKQQATPQTANKAQTPKAKDPVIGVKPLKIKNDMAEGAVSPRQGSSFTLVEGFASDVPLVVALKQVVPQDYTLSFSSDIDLGIAVSWTGGRPWNVTLQDMLLDAGLQARIDGQSVRILSQKRGAADDGDTTIAEVKTLAPAENIASVTPSAEISAPAGDTARTETQNPFNLLSKIEPAAGAQEADQPIKMTKEVPLSTPKGSWVADSGESLRDIIAGWSKRSDTSLYWDVSGDFNVEQAFSSNAKDLESAVSEIVKNQDESADLKITYHEATHMTQPILVIRDN